MQQLAAAVVRDNGITNPIRALAGLGCGGQFPINCGRHYNRLEFPGMVLPYQIDIPITMLEGLNTDYKQAFVLLLHEVFSTLHAEWPASFDCFLNTGNISQFWERESRHRTPPPRAAQTIPLRAWGDVIARPAPC